MKKQLISAFADESSEDFVGQLDAVRRNGISHIEIRSIEGRPIHRLPLDEVHRIKLKADGQGVGFSAVGSALGKCDIDGDMEEQNEMCKYLVEIAHALDTRYIRMFSFRMPAGQSPETYRQKVIDAIGMFIDLVKDTGIMLVHENENHIYGETAERCLDLYQTFESTGVFKGAFDFANFVQAGEDPVVDCWPQLKPYIEYFHIKDAIKEDKRVVPAGEGDGGIRTILRDAFSSGFNSFLTLEPHLWPRYFAGNAEERFDLAADALHKLLAELQDG
jgi:sugar phosphate isomerase/epimerase